MGELYVGTSGWSYPDWKGIVYPQAPGKLNELEYLSHYFDTVEINTTFYRPPNPAYCLKWLRDVQHNPRFKFTAKLWQRFTHERTQKWTPDEARLFKDGIAPLHKAGKLGVLLVQFPWAFPNVEASPLLAPGHRAGVRRISPRRRGPPRLLAERRVHGLLPPAPPQLLQH